MYEGIQGKMKVNKNEERNEGINLRMENDNMKEERKAGRMKRWWKTKTGSKEGYKHGLLGGKKKKGRNKLY
jgi:hypothetical protein